jgi:hypothetical protein
MSGWWSPVCAPGTKRLARRVDQAGSLATSATTWSARLSASLPSGADDLLGGIMQGVGVALNGIVEPSRGVADSSEQGAG